MMKKILSRKYYFILFAGLLTFIISMPAFAETVNFNITVSSTARIDPISKRAMKADGEQQCYVTVTGGSGTGKLNAHSERLFGGVVSMNMQLSTSNIGQTQKRGYAKEARAGDYYFLNTSWSSGRGQVNLLGRYTP